MIIWEVKILKTFYLPNEECSVDIQPTWSKSNEENETIKFSVLLKNTILLMTTKSSAYYSIWNYFPLF